MARSWRVAYFWYFCLQIMGVWGSSKYNQRVFMDVQSINFADPLKHGFRVILADEFIQKHLAPTILPTLFITALPLKEGGARFTQVIYPESISENKLVKITDLQERSWYYVCVEWENINRHNETTGTNCRLYRTLDRFGKTAVNTVADVEVVGMTDVSLRFQLKVDADFPLRLTAYLSGGTKTTAAQVVVTKEPSNIDLVFPFLEPETAYGKLCILEEPLTTGYTAMGRYVSGMTREKCYFEGLKTKSPNLQLATEPEIIAYKRVMSNDGCRTVAVSLFIMLIVNLASLLL